MIYKRIPADSGEMYAGIDDDGICRITCRANHPALVEWIAEGNTPLPADVIVPEPCTSIKAWQGVLWLGYHGHTETVDAAISQMAPPMQTLAKMCMTGPDTIWWIHDVIVQHMMSTVLDLTEDQIQAAFVEAGSYTWPS